MNARMLCDSWMWSDALTEPEPQSLASSTYSFWVDFGAHAHIVCHIDGCWLSDIIDFVTMFVFRRSRSCCASTPPLRTASANSIRFSPVSSSSGGCINLLFLVLFPPVVRLQAATYRCQSGVHLFHSPARAHNSLARKALLSSPLVPAPLRLDCCCGG